MRARLRLTQVQRDSGAGVWFDQGNLGISAVSAARAEGARGMESATAGSAACSPARTWRHWRRCRRQRYRCHGHESRIPHERPRGVSQVLPEPVEPGPSPHFAHHLFPKRCVAERPLHGLPLPDRNAVRAPDRARARHALARTPQLPPAGHMICAIAPVICLHFDSSARNCFFPAEVKR